MDQPEYRALGPADLVPDSYHWVASTRLCVGGCEYEGVGGRGIPLEVRGLILRGICKKYDGEFWELPTIS